MKLKLLLLAIFLTQYSMVSFAVNDNLSTANSAANSTNNAQSITFNSVSPSHTKATVESTANPSMGGFSGSFSSDYCGATMQASAGAVGFGFSAGGPKIDSSCIMLRTFERTQQAASSVAPTDPVQAAILRKASLEILALIDPKVKEVFEKMGLIGNSSNIAKSEPKVVENKITKNILPAEVSTKPEVNNKQNNPAGNSVEPKLESNKKSDNPVNVDSPAKNKIDGAEQLAEQPTKPILERKSSDSAPAPDAAQASPVSDAAQVAPAPDAAQASPVPDGAQFVKVH